MKKNSGRLTTLAFLAHLLVSCTTNPATKIKIEIPAAPVINIASSPEIILTNFWQEKEIKDLNLGQELMLYFKEELPLQFQGKIVTKKIPWENAEQTKNKEFWKQIPVESKETVFLTGKVQFTQEVRKALLEKGIKNLDGPFAPPKAWAERIHYALKIDIYLIKADSGEIFFQKDFQESMNLENQKQTPGFAFFDLIQRIKTKFFHALLGSEKIQDRYLLLKS